MSHAAQEVADRLEINDLLVRYTHAIDSSRWDLLDQVFTPDAQIDYSVAGGAKGPYPEIKEWLAKALGNFSYTMHFIGNTSVAFDADGNGASSRTYCINPMGFKNKDGSSAAFNCYVHYVDKLVRTPDGWRIAERVEQEYFMDGPLPGELEIPE